MTTLSSIEQRIADLKQELEALEQRQQKDKLLSEIPSCALPIQQVERGTYYAIIADIGNAPTAFTAHPCPAVGLPFNEKLHKTGNYCATAEQAKAFGRTFTAIMRARQCDIVSTSGAGYSFYVEVNGEVRIKFFEDGGTPLWPRFANWCAANEALKRVGEDEVVFTHLFMSNQGEYNAD